MVLTDARYPIARRQLRLRLIVSSAEEAGRPVLELDRHSDRVLLPEATPRGAHTTLDSSGSFAISLAALHGRIFDLRTHFQLLVVEKGPAIRDVLPNIWQVPDVRVEQPDALRALWLRS